MAEAGGRRDGEGLLPSVGGVRRGGGGAVRGLPGGGRDVSGVGADAVPHGQRGGAGARPLPGAEPGARALLLGQAGGRRPGFAAQHLQGAEERHQRLPRPQQRIPRELGRAGHPDAQHRAHRPRRSHRLTPRQGLGDFHRRRHRARQREEGDGDLRPLGARRAEQGVED